MPAQNMKRRVLTWKRAGGRMKRVEVEQWNLSCLPSTIIIQICDSLHLEDVVALIRTNKYLHSLLTSWFLPTLKIPPTSSPTRKKRILRLISNGNVHHFPSIDTLDPFKSLNLSKLKELCFIGNNHVWNKQYLLSDQYKKALDFLLGSLNRVSIKRLEFLTDESLACVRLLENLSTFYNLDEVTVHGIGYFNPCASYHMDKEIAQKIINQVLRNPRLKILKLKSFQTINRCLVFESRSLEKLEAELGKSFEIGLLNLPRARFINIDTSMWYGCFYHAQNGELKKIVKHGCPSIERFNGIDLRGLDHDQATNWDWSNLLKEQYTRLLEDSGGECVLCSDQLALQQ